MISLLLATINRTKLIERFLDSLVRQNYRDFEVIIIDQNNDNRLAPIIGKYNSSMKIYYLHSPIGLSRARNLGLTMAHGDVIAFPDDDCWYSPDLLQNVADKLAQKKYLGGITGRAGLKINSQSQWRWDAEEGQVNRKNIWARGISISVFLRREVVSVVGEFDEQLGVGSGTTWGSGEETDYLIRAIDRGFTIWYDPTLFVFHEDRLPEYTDDDMSRAILYGAGMGKVLRKQKYPIITVGYFITRPIITSAYAVLCGHLKRAEYYLLVAKGRFKGFTS